MKYVPYKYQQHAFQHILDNPHCGLFLDMGLGKTVITLTALNRLMYEECEIMRTLIVAPKNVALNVWKQEAAKWDHLKHLKFSIVWGKNAAERVAALQKPADIYVINRENLVWLITKMQSRFPFDMVVLDELSSFKNHASQRFKIFNMVRNKPKRIVGLTGTPAPNSLIDLWAQVYLLDGGERLEKNITGYRNRYFVSERVEGFVSSYHLRRDAAEVIYGKIGDICISMKSEDYLDLPPLIINDIQLEMDAKTQQLYNEFEEEQIMEIADKEVTALSAGALTGKLLQFANGAIYHTDHSYSEIHSTKLDALDDLLDESQGQPVIVFYSFRHDLERIRKRHPHARVLKTPQDVLDWNLGKIPLLIAHPASAGHGLNLQQGGHIMVWFGLTWSLELYMQAIARLQRQGQTISVIIHRIIMKHTMDPDVARALNQKMKGQNALMEAIKARIDKYVKHGNITR